MTGVRQLADYRRRKELLAAQQRPRATRYYLYLHTETTDEYDEPTVAEQISRLRELAESFSWTVTESAEPVEGGAE